MKDDVEPLGRRRWLPWPAAAAALLVAGVLAGAAASSNDSPLANAEAAVSSIVDGDVRSGCAALKTSLERDWAIAAQLEGVQRAGETCIDAELEAARASASVLAKEQALLAIVASDATLTPSDAQFQRIEREVAGLSGALQDGAPRLRLVSYEVVGPIAIEVMRQHSRAQHLRLRGCHARAAAAGQPLADELTLRLRVSAEGVASDTKVKPANPTFEACAKQSFDNAALPAADAGSVVTIALKTRPFE